MSQKVKVIDGEDVISEVEVDTSEEHIRKFTRTGLIAFKYGVQTLNETADAITKCSVGLINEIIKQQDMKSCGAGSGE